LRTIVFACVITVATGLVFALTPTLRLASTARRTEDLREGLAGGRGSTGMLWRRFGSNLVVVELATAVVLLVGAGLLCKSFYRLLQVDPGLQADHLATLKVMPGDRYPEDEQLVALSRQILDQTRHLPGVRSVGLTSQLPLGDGDGISEFCVFGRTCHGEQNAVAFRYVSNGYLRTLLARILRGRDFGEQDRSGNPGAAIINQTLASQYFPGENPVGLHIFRVSEPKKSMEIVGIVNDLQEGQLDAAPRAAIYMPFDQSPSNSMALVVRVSQAEESVLPALSSAIRRIDPEIVVADPVTMGQRIHNSPSADLHRSSAWIVGAFAAIALLLGVVGLYGVIAYSVGQRTREIGVRMALGARRSSVYLLIMKEAGWLTGLGITLGLICSLGAGVLMRSLLFGTRAWDLTTLAGVAIILASAAMLASYLPARRAAAVNPVEALRSE
jgi:macrolide transport system ATP-binding/permease protein